MLTINLSKSFQGFGKLVDIRTFIRTFIIKSFNSMLNKLPYKCRLKMKKRHKVQMIKVRNSLTIVDRFYLLSQIFPKQKNVIIKDLNNKYT